MKTIDGKLMVKKIALIVCSIVFGLTGLISMNFVWSIALLSGGISILIIFPLSIYFLYASFNGNSKRVLAGLVIVLAYMFPVVAFPFHDIGDIVLAHNVFGMTDDIFIPKESVPWNWRHIKDPHSIFSIPRTLFFIIVPLTIGFALIESGGWCFRKAHTGSLSPKICFAVKGVTLFLVNAMNLTMFAAIAGLIVNKSTWSYGFFGLIAIAAETILLAVFIWGKPNWRWWMAMILSTVVFYVTMFWIGAHLNNGVIDVPWNKSDDRGTIESPRHN